MNESSGDVSGNTLEMIFGGGEFQFDIDISCRVDGYGPR